MEDKELSLAVDAPFDVLGSTEDLLAAEGKAAQLVQRRLFRRRFQAHLEGRREAFAIQGEAAGVDRAGHQGFAVAEAVFAEHGAARDGGGGGAGEQHPGKSRRHQLLDQHRHAPEPAAAAFLVGQATLRKIGGPAAPQRGLSSARLPTGKIESSWPANEAAAESSPRAELRTITGAEMPRQRSSSSIARPAGSSASRIVARRAAPSAAVAFPATASPSAAKAAASITKPGGTGIPCPASRARLPALAPSAARS